MTYKAGVFLFAVVYIPHVISWTIDLPEVRRHFFEKNEGKKKNYESFGKQDSFFYDNIDGNSKHNSDEHHETRSNFPQQSDMEQKVTSLAHDGGRYLEGLRRSIESYVDFLENCTRMNSASAPNMTVSPWGSQLEQLVPAAGSVVNSSMVVAACAQVTRASEHVRRLAQLAADTTRRLQDLAYIEMYQKDVSEEEDELIFKLASFLDRLAHLTGFRPDPKKFLEEPVTSTTTPAPLTLPVPATLVNVTEEVKLALLRCLKNKTSSAPATVRCSFPYTMAPELMAILNMSSNSSTPSPDAPTEVPGGSPPQLMELLVGSDAPAFARPAAADPVPNRFSSSPITTFLGINPFFQRIQKRSLNTPRSQRSEPTNRNIKRSIDENPAIHFMKYFVKHNVWTNSNPGRNYLEMGNLKPSNFEVKNDLPVKYVEKRSLFRRKTPPFRRPQHTLRIVKDRIKETIGAHYFKNKEQIIKLKNTLDSIRSITYKKSVTKANVHKRSVHYEKMELPKESEDPKQDLSYYVKNKKGTHIAPNLAQAAQVRLGLEQVFQTGNIEVVRRFGANYNPLIPAPFYAGVLRSMADI